jgi:hypothetical protein
MRKKRKTKLAYDKMCERINNRKTKEQIILKMVKDILKEEKPIASRHLGYFITRKGNSKAIMEINRNDVVKIKTLNGTKWLFGRLVDIDGNIIEMKIIILDTIMNYEFKRNEHILRVAKKRERKNFEQRENLIIAKKVAEKI